MTSLKIKVIGGAWTAVAGYTGYRTYRNAKEFEDRAPCLRNALSELSCSTAARGVLGAGDLKVGFWSRKLILNAEGGSVRANFMVHGEGGSAWVFMSARRGEQAQVAFEAALEEEEEQLTGFRYYWSRPWEIKRLIVDSARGAVGRTAAKISSSESQEELPWNLDTLFFLPEGDVRLPSVLLGEARGIPEFEAICVRGDADSKDERSRRRLKVFGGIVGGLALLAGGARLIKSMGVSKSYGYVRRSVLAHPAVVDALGPGASISTSSGTFKPNFLNTSLRLVGKGGAVADVDFAATKELKNGRRGPWRVAVARMNWAGSTQNLEKAYF